MNLAAGILFLTLVGGPVGITLGVIWIVWGVFTILAALLS